MSNNCIVSNCPNASGAGPDVSMFFLPADKYSATLWLRRVGRLDLQRPSGNSYKYMHQVCFKHFSNRQFNTHASFKKPRLLPNALPDQALPVASKVTEYSSWPTAIAPKPVTAEASRAVLCDVAKAPAAPSPLVHVPVECELGEDAHEADSEGEDQSFETSTDAASHKQTSSSQMLELKIDTIDSLQGLQPGVSGTDGAAKKVVRLHLPKGVTLQEFTASKTFKNLTSKLPSLVDLNSANKPILLKVPMSASGDIKVDSSEATSDASASVAETADDGAIENLSANISGGNIATKIQLVRVKARSTLCSSSTAPSSGLGKSGRQHNQASRYQDTYSYDGEDGEDVDPDDPTEDSTNSRESSKRDLSESEPWQGKINILKKRKLDEGGVGLPAPQSNESAAGSGEQGSPSQTATAGCVNGKNDSVSDKRAYYKFMHDLDVKRRQRNNLLEKIRRQKELLIKRSNELHRYRVQLQRIREKNSKRREMTTAECIKVLNGNMREHALELLYTQLMAAESARTSAEAQVGPEGDSASARNGNVKPSISAGPESGDSAAATELVYTPKVLEAALLFSVAGKKAYKAMTQSLKLPSYTEIVKWKNIIRSNPPFYKKHFPNLKAKFFKKRRPEERGKRRSSGTGSSHTGDADAELDGWQSEREESHKLGDNSSKKSESQPLTTEEAEMMYKKLIEAEKKFQALLGENDAPNRASKLEEEGILQDLVPEEEEVDYDLDASSFIKKLKKREKQLLFGKTWDQRHVQLSDQNDDPSDSEVINSRSLSDSDQTTVELTSVNEAIDKVISSVVRQGPGNCLEDSGTRTLSITVNSDGSPEVIQDDKDGMSDEYDNESENLPDISCAKLKQAEQGSHQQCQEDYSNAVSEGILVSQVEQTTATSLATNFTSLLESTPNVMVSSTADASNQSGGGVDVYPAETYFKPLKKVTFNVPDDQPGGGRALEPLLDQSLPFTVDNNVIKGISFKILDSSDKAFGSSAAAAPPPETSDEAQSTPGTVESSETQPEPSMPRIF